MTAEPPVLPDSEDGWRALGERLRTAREYIGYSQAEVAKALDVTRPAVTNMEQGRRKVSGLELAALARLYRRPFEYFLGQTASPADDPTVQALFRAAKNLSERDRQQVVQFAEFLGSAGRAPRPRPEDEQA
jgi:transcriptional regulator with XRE-family HTH domain